MNHQKLIILVLFVIAILVACDGSKSPVNGGAPYLEPVDSVLFNQARIMSLWYGDDMLPDTNLASRFYDNLITLRTVFGDSIPQVYYSFVYPGSVSKILVGFTDSARTEFRNGTYRSLDSISQIYDVVKIDTTSYFDRSPFASIRFSDLKKPEFLAGEYYKLDGIWSSQSGGLIGDRSNIYPWLIDNQVTFLVREAWGDCPAGCIYNNLFYFKESSGTMKLIGRYYNGEELPDWWDEAKIAVYHYWRRNL